MGVIRGYRQQLGRLIENYNCIVLIKDMKLPPILLSRTATALGWKFLHCGMADRALQGGCVNRVMKQRLMSHCYANHRYATNIPAG
jgi:hypothetical protein